MDNSTADFQTVASRVTLGSIAGNLVLSAGKLLAGLLAHSGAMVSDAIHSASDVFSSVVVLIGIRISAKNADSDHPYGHERMECVAAIVLACILFMTGLLIGISALDALKADAAAPTVPGLAALIAAVVSIVVKELMYQHTRAAAKRIDSSALMADAWHHRSDALSSVGALIGIWGARHGHAWMDPAASLVICFFIAKAAYDIFREAMDKMVDRACDPETEAQLRACAADQPGVNRVDLLHTRVFGNKIYVDLEISADAEMSLRQAHDIAQAVHDRIESEFPKVKHIMVHVNPDGEAD